jgi:hypothetical protein
MEINMTDPPEPDWKLAPHEELTGKLVKVIMAEIEDGGINSNDLLNAMAMTLSWVVANIPAEQHTEVRAGLMKEIPKIMNRAANAQADSRAWLRKHH